MIVLISEKWFSVDNDKSCSAAKGTLFDASPYSFSATIKVPIAQIIPIPI